jgi:hypothetical protein
VLLAFLPLPLLAENSSSSSHLYSLELSGFAPHLAALPAEKIAVCDLLLVIVWSFSGHELDVLALLVVMLLLVFEIAPPW